MAFSVKLRGVALLVVVVAVWQCCVLFHGSPTQRTSCSADLRSARDRVALLERALRETRECEHLVQRSSTPSSESAAGAPHHNLVSPIVSRIRGGPLETVDVNFTLFDKRSIARFNVVSVLPRVRVVLMIISSQGDRSAKQRRLIRSTWLAQLRAEVAPTEVVARFFLGTATDSPALRPEVVAEMATHGDVVVVDVGDMYGGLIAKVQASIQWAVANYRADFVAKFDDDCYVAPRALLNELEAMPMARLYWGKMMGGGPVQRSGNRNSEPNLPHGVDWFPPYASGGGGYVLSWDLAHAVAFPPVKLLEMVNEDGHLGVFLLPYDVARRSSRKVYPYGIQRDHGGCTLAADIIAIHYVKDKGKFDCMAAIHANVTAGLPVCESRFCGPINCDFKFPWPRKGHAHRCKPASVSTLTSRWSTIHAKRSCEVNGEGVNRFFVAKRMRDVSCCQRLCESLCDCTAVDYYANTAWCNLYTQPCSTPQKGTEGASSFRLDRSALE